MHGGTTCMFTLIWSYYINVDKGGQRRNIYMLYTILNDFLVTEDVDNLDVDLRVIYFLIMW